MNLTRGSNVQPVASERVNTSVWFPVAGIDFAGGDDTVFQTGWQSVSFNVVGYRGQLVTSRYASST